MKELFATALAAIGFESMADILKRPDPKPLIAGLIDELAVCLIYGESGAGKTFFVLDLILHICLGQRWIGRRTTRGSVVYVFGEGGGGLKRRLLAWFMAMRKQKNNAPLVFRSAVNLFNDAEVDAFIAQLIELNAVARHAIKAIVFDTLARCMVGAEENSNTAMGIIVRNCERIRDALGVAVILVHHTGKNAENKERGASALRCAVDTAIAVKPHGKAGLRVEVEKQKDGEKGSPLLFDLEVVPLPKGKTSCVVRLVGEAAEQQDDGRPVLSSNQRALFNIINADFGIEWSVARTRAKGMGIGGNRSSALAELKAALIDKGFVREEEDGRLYPAANPVS